MANEFYALMGRMRYIARWGLMRNNLPENIQEHSHQVAVLAHALALIRRDILNLPTPDPDRCAVAALYHDASEILTGDLPTPIKYFNPDIKSAYKQVEHVAGEKLLDMLPPQLRESYARYVLEDDPELTTRLVRGKNPVRVVLDSSLKISLMATVLNPLADTIIFTGLDSDIVKAEALAALPNVEVVRLPLADGVLPVAQVVQALAERGITSLLVEGGSAIHGAFFDAGLADRVCAFVAPKLIGGAAALPPVGGAGSSLVETGWQLTEVEIEKLGSDVLITGMVPELDKQELPKEAE